MHLQIIWQQKLIKKKTSEEPCNVCESRWHFNIFFSINLRPQSD